MTTDGELTSVKPIQILAFAKALILYDALIIRSLNIQTTVYSVCQKICWQHQETNRARIHDLYT